MSAAPTHATVAGRTYLALRKLAHEDGRTTEEYLRLAALEAFVVRLVSSPRAQDLVLKGGVLLAAYNARRPTRDVDLAARRILNEPSAVAEVWFGWALAAGAAKTGVEAFDAALRLWHLRGSVGRQ